MNKSPILTVDLNFQGYTAATVHPTWIITFMRRYQPPRAFVPSEASVQRITHLIKQMSLKGFVGVSPDSRGWTAYVDRTKYPKGASDDRE